MNQETEIYEGLARFLDELPGGFPRSESGVELRILRHLFTPEEARVAQQLSLIPEEARVIARRAGLPLDTTARLLEELDRKRLVYCFPQAGQPLRYMAQQFLIGIWESQVDRLDRELVEEFEQYLPVYAKAGLWSKVPQLRTIPIKQSIPTQTQVLAYEHIDEIIGSHSRFAVANCICRQEMRVLGQDCGKPLETCLVTDDTVDYYLRVGRGREISRAEALSILEQAEKAGLVLQVGNDQRSGSVCMCCGCCCGALRVMKTLPHPAAQAASAFYARLDAELCAGCETCIERCQMDALTMQDGRAALDLDRCIGCGLCVSTCTTGALSLARKDQPPAVPKDIVQLNIRMARSRGKLGPGEMVRLVARSAIDRFLSRI